MARYCRAGGLSDRSEDGSTESFLSERKDGTSTPTESSPRLSPTTPVKPQFSPKWNLDSPLTSPEQNGRRVVSLRCLDLKDKLESIRLRPSRAYMRLPELPLSPISLLSSPSKSVCSPDEQLYTPPTSPEPIPRKLHLKPHRFSSVRGKIWKTRVNSEPQKPTKKDELEPLPDISKRQPSKAIVQLDGEGSGPRKRVISPDRFIPNRDATPTKEAFHTYVPQARRNPRDVDPFVPSFQRSLRFAEQYATLRGPRPAPRPPGRQPTRVTARPVSQGTVWTVGGTAVIEGVASTTTGRGGRMTSGSSAPHHLAGFLGPAMNAQDVAQHKGRLALAMDIDPATRMVGNSPLHVAPKPRVWRNGRWETTMPSTQTATPKKATKRDVSTLPFRVLDAPALRDDFYCSLLAYSPTLDRLAVGLGPHVFLWSEGLHSPDVPDALMAPGMAHVTSMSFSSTAGGGNILAVGRADGRVTLWNPQELDPRCHGGQESPVSALCFRPQPVRRPSARDPLLMVWTEELLVRDEAGQVCLYSVEWPDSDLRHLWGWPGRMKLLVRIQCHTQQVCGLAWSPNGEEFATGGNDNGLYMYGRRKVLASSTLGEVGQVLPGEERHVVFLNAAVKAIAFAPWWPRLVAAGGGSNDRCIHFFDTHSGARLATIDCQAQVTSLVWSQRKKEITATFGFAQPDHPYRVAVFAWPSCRTVVAIPWWSGERALWAVAYPGKGGVQGQKGDKEEREGIAIATSDASIKFHELGGRINLKDDWQGSPILEGVCFTEEVERAIR
ncbi:WD40 repeat-like protein [Piedraia hortae CBS 480.64]|uniref:WD40 repeat-like protein n=1 Tax=Piedraia hortae CBS 480.64 TaxID=1314780 RepID=A0A6A7BW36_9PEZI|nr:WD40 repeat-like protein [Piedraia hortae CBS 480.64]